MPVVPPIYSAGGNAASCLEACIERIHAREGEVKAWAALNLPAAREAAAALDAEAAAGTYRGPLHGVPLGVKDLFDVAGFQTRAGSASRAQVAPAEADAPLVAALRDAGCVILGKTHTTEFAYLDPTVTVNPFDPAHTPGGSSSGTGAAVGAGMVPLALGTQTVGSVCRPAAYCGAAAFKPTTGSTTMQAVVPFSSSYDTVGFFAPRLQLAIDAWQQVCARGAAKAGSGRGSAIAPADVGGLRFALPSDAYFADLDEDIALALQVSADLLQRAGARRVPLKLGVPLESMRGLQRTVMFHEAAQAHRDLLNAEPATFERLGPHWREGLAYGASITQAQHDEADRRLKAISADALRAAADADLVLVPAARSTAPTRETTGDPGLILPWTVFGSPLAVLPLGLSARRLPVAVMLAGRPDQDRRLASIALAMQSLIESAGGGSPIRPAYRL